MKINLKDPIFKILAAAVDKNQVEAYVVGGWVRDFLLRRNHNEKDIDIVVLGSGTKAAKQIANSIDPNINVTTFRNFGTAMFRINDYQIEFVGARKESYDRGSRKPVVENGSLEDDQKRRDFTINAMAFSLNMKSFGDFLDPFGGVDDLENRIIRTPLDANSTFSDDPLRMLRAIRFASQLDFSLEEGTYEGIKNNIDRMEIVSKERIVTELNKIIMSKKPSVGFELMEKTGLLKITVPELAALKGVEQIEGKGHKDNFLHTISVLDNISRQSDSLWLRWAALLHDIGKAPTKKYIPGIGWAFHGHDFIGSKMIKGIFNRLKLPKGENMRYVAKMIELHLRPIVLSQEIITDSAVRRLLFDAGEDIDDLMTLCEADITSKNETRKKRHLKNFALVRKRLKEIEEKDALRNFQPPVDGIEIIETFGIKPGKEVGIIKNAIREAILDGIIPNNHDAAKELMLKKGREMGLTDK